MRTGRPPQDPVKRFLEKVNKTDSCWIWTGGLCAGYGHFYLNGKTIKAHRYSYELHREKIPANLVLDHLCRNPSCVNPDHLEIVTSQENCRRGIWSNIKRPIMTHCKRGHEFTKDNVIHHKKGTKTCLKCSLEYRERHLKKLREINASKPKPLIQKITHCKRGHEFNENNTKIITGNRRRCLSCYESYKLKNRNFNTRGNWTHCIAGHEFTPENTRVNNGKRVCKMCSTERVRKFREKNKK